MALSFFAEFTIRYNDKMSEELQICLKEGREERQANRTHRKEQRKAKKEARRVEKKVAKHYELEEVVCVAPRIYSNLTSPKAYDQKFGFAIYDGDGGEETATKKAKTTEIMDGKWLSASTSRRASLNFTKGDLFWAYFANKIKGLVNEITGITSDKEILENNTGNTPPTNNRGVEINEQGMPRNTIKRNPYYPYDTVYYHKDGNYPDTMITVLYGKKDTTKTTWVKRSQLARVYNACNRV